MSKKERKKNNPLHICAPKFGGCSYIFKLGALVLLSKKVNFEPCNNIEQCDALFTNNASYNRIESNRYLVNRNRIES